MNESSRVKIAVKLIEEGCVTNALSNTGSEGPRSLSLRAIQGQLAVKSPGARGLGITCHFADSTSISPTSRGIKRTSAAEQGSGWTGPVTGTSYGQFGVR